MSWLTRNITHHRNHGAPEPWTTPDFNTVQWTPDGFPIGLQGPPQGDAAYQYQFRAEQLARQRQQALWGDSHNQLRQGLRLMQSYRPGGAAAMASGLYQYGAGLYAQQAQSLEAPDLMADVRKRAQEAANAAAGRARRFGMWLGAIGTVGNVVGAVTGLARGGGGGGGLASGGLGDLFAGLGGSLMGQQAGSSTMMGPGYTNSPNAMGGPQPLPQDFGQPYAGPMARPQWGAQDSQNFNPGMGGTFGGGTAQSRIPGSGGDATNGPNPQGGQRREQGGVGGGPGPAGGPGGPGAGPGGGGGVGIGHLGGLGQDGLFNNTALAAAGMRASPAAEAVVTMELEQDPDRERTTRWMAQGAAIRLAIAMGAQ